MSEIVNMHQAKSSLSRLVERALAGEEPVIIARTASRWSSWYRCRSNSSRGCPGKYKGKDLDRVPILNLHPMREINGSCSMNGLLG